MQLFLPHIRQKQFCLKLATISVNTILHFKGALFPEVLLIINCCHGAYYSGKYWAQAETPFPTGLAQAW